MPGEVWAIVVAAGGGSRFGRPKQFEPMANRLVVEWAVDGARTITDDIVLVVPRDAMTNIALHAGCEHVVEGGATRSASVRNGLAAVSPTADIVVIHDAARPLASKGLFHAVVAAVIGGADAAVPAVPVSDTVKRVAGIEVVETLDRTELVAVQTPQAFRAETLRRAHIGDPEATDDAALIEALSGSVVVVPGEIQNAKLTQSSDLTVLESLLSHAMDES